MLRCACIHGWGGVGWGMYYRSCELASCYAATVSSLELCTHTYVMLRYHNFSWTLHSYVMLRYCNFSWALHSYVMAQMLDRSWKSLKDFLPAHMVLKHKERGHSTLHPSVTQYVFMWCWHSSLESPDPQRFWKNWKRCSDQKTTKNMWGRSSFRVGKKIKNSSFGEIPVFVKLHHNKGLTTSKVTSHKFLLAGAHQTWSMTPR